MLNKHFLSQAREVCGYLLGSIIVAIHNRYTDDTEAQGTKQCEVQEIVGKDSGLGKCINLCFSPDTPLKQQCENYFSKASIHKDKANRGKDSSKKGLAAGKETDV